MFYILTLVPVAMLALAIIRFWGCLRRLGLAHEVFRRAPNMFALDAVTLFLAAMVGYWAMHSWVGFMLPVFQKEPMAEWETIFMAMLCCFSSLAVGYFNSGDRFNNHTVAGMRESALRTLAALRILDAAELVQAIKIVEANRGRPLRSGQVIDSNEEPK